MLLKDAFSSNSNAAKWTLPVANAFIMKPKTLVRGYLLPNLITVKMNMFDKHY